MEIDQKVDSSQLQTVSNELAQNNQNLDAQQKVVGQKKNKQDQVSRKRKEKVVQKEESNNQKSKNVPQFDEQNGKIKKAQRKKASQSQGQIKLEESKEKTSINPFEKKSIQKSSLRQHNDTKKKDIREVQDFSLLTTKYMNQYEIKKKQFKDQNGNILHKNRNSVENLIVNSNEEQKSDKILNRLKKKLYQTHKNDITIDFLHQVDVPFNLQNNSLTVRKKRVQSINDQTSCNIYDTEANLETSPTRPLFKASIEKHKSNLKVWSKGMKNKQQPFGRIGTKENQLKNFNRSQVFDSQNTQSYLEVSTNQDIQKFTNKAEKQFSSNLRDYQIIQRGQHKKSMSEMFTQIKKSKDCYNLQ